MTLFVVNNKQTSEAYSSDKSDSDLDLLTTLKSDANVTSSGREINTDCWFNFG